MADIDEKDRSRDSGRDRDRSRRGDRPSRFSEGSNVRDRSVDRGGNDRGGRKSSSSRVYVSNISYEYRWQDLKDLFREKVGDVAFVELFVDDHDKPKGCGIVEFSDSASVKKCMEVMHRFELNGRKLVIKEDFGNERDKFGNIINGRRNRDRERQMDKGDWDDMRDRHRGGGGGGGGGGSGGGGGGGIGGMGGIGGIGGGCNWDNNPPSLMNLISKEPVEYKWGNTYGLSPQFLESLNINRPLVNRVFVANVSTTSFPTSLKLLVSIFVSLFAQVLRLNIMDLFIWCFSLISLVHFIRLGSFSGYTIFVLYIFFIYYYYLFFFVFTFVYYFPWVHSVLELIIKIPTDDFVNTYSKGLIFPWTTLLDIFFVLFIHLSIFKGSTPLYIVLEC